MAATSAASIALLTLSLFAMPSSALLVTTPVASAGLTVHAAAEVTVMESTGGECEVEVGPHSAHVAAKGVGGYSYSQYVRVGSLVIINRHVDHDLNPLITEFAPSRSFTISYGQTVQASAWIVSDTLDELDTASASFSYRCGTVGELLQVGALAAGPGLPSLAEAAEAESPVASTFPSRLDALGLPILG